MVNHQQVNMPLSQPNHKITKGLWGLYYKTFYGCNIRILVIARVFVPGKPLQSSLMFVGKARVLL
jgi:hypothetical protein